MEYKCAVFIITKFEQQTLCHNDVLIRKQRVYQSMSRVFTFINKDNTLRNNIY